MIDRKPREQRVGRDGEHHEGPGADIVTATDE
jgi:hypothetical protein